MAVIFLLLLYFVSYLQFSESATNSTNNTNSLSLRSPEGMIENRGLDKRQWQELSLAIGNAYSMGLGGMRRSNNITGPENNGTHASNGVDVIESIKQIEVKTRRIFDALRELLPNKKNSTNETDGPQENLHNQVISELRTILSSLEELVIKDNNTKLKDENSYILSVPVILTKTFYPSNTKFVSQPLNRRRKRQVDDNVPSTTTQTPEPKTISNANQGLDITTTEPSENVTTTSEATAATNSSQLETVATAATSVSTTSAEPPIARVDNETQSLDTEPCNCTNCALLAENRRADFENRRHFEEIRKKLISYIDESFNDTSDKINSVKSFKDQFLKENIFKIGYIVSNLDTLEVNLKNLKNEMNRNQSVWEDFKIMELFDKLKTSQKVVTNLVDVLRAFVRKAMRERTALQSHPVNFDRP